MTNRHSLSADALERLDAFLSELVDDGSEPGIASAVACAGQEHVTLVGSTSFGNDVPIQRDTLFRISSMSKPITAVATLILIGEGLSSLDAPVERWLPELANLGVLRDPAGPLDDTVPAHRPITVEDLLTFRPGLGALLDDSPLARALAEAKVQVGPPDPAGHLPPDAWLAALAGLPLAYQPGERWLYHTGAEVLGILLARATGSTLGEVFRERIFEPLGMVDTAFTVPPDTLARLTDAYLPDPESGQPVSWDPAATSAWASGVPFEDGAGGLVSTLDDYLRFARMMASGGVHDGRRLVPESLHRRMTTNHLTAEQIDGAGFFLDGTGWGYGQAVSIPGNDHPGRYGWGGGLGSCWWNDPANDLVMILLSPVAVWGEVGQRLIGGWEAAVYAALQLRQS
jgi:CubicO group peptidase (beta-lactamase class C family)